MTYTVKEISEIANISVRTVHYYDEINLLKPSIVGDNGYRYYSEVELSRLQIILFYKELDFNLKDIKNMMENPAFDRITALEQQKELVQLKIARFERIHSSLTNAIRDIKRGGKMKSSKLFDSLNTDQLDQYKKEAKEKYGKKIYSESEERFKKHFNSDPNAVAAEYERIFASIEATGLKDIKDKLVQDAISDLFILINKFWDCSKEAFKGLASMYVEDDRFRDNYVKSYGEEFPEFLRDAMIYFADK